ncbi:MAG: LpxL/LpxP family Kdo(2)-lipid IV(A) lauroyl/palmitoleoyl acyltransferase [Gammaproteobacteria bacterium]|nr:LpxL/LpxP family Kdo(2)-lipid IV(A) lauroyl/palmitoleoyl acyltransferase [Gammaproteobacteria bacterium]MDH5692836.1 LpxL/LpxP family Kdo(2)-lipid IV(A) lauroyl/palmitoleoyl acyltransferase [Gammaproteobacteria bacterium]
MSIYGPRYWHIWLAVGLLRLVTLLPHRLRLTVGRLLGKLFFQLAKSRRRVAEVNIRLCMPNLNQQERDQLVKQHIESVGIGLIETGMCWWSSHQELIKLTQFNGLEHLRDALKAGNGAILLAAHFTTLELGLRLLTALQEFPINSVYQVHKNPLLEKLFFENRGKNTGLIPQNEIRQMIKLLKANKVVWYAPDQGYEGKYSELVPFFGVPANSNTATSRLAKLTGAVVLPFFERRLDDGTYALDILPPIESFPSDDPILDTERFHHLIEAEARRVPEQYLWVHRRFKRRPPEYPDVYA